MNGALILMQKLRTAYIRHRKAITKLDALGKRFVACPLRGLTIFADLVWKTHQPTWKVIRINPVKPILIPCRILA